MKNQTIIIKYILRNISYNIVNCNKYELITDEIMLKYIIIATTYCKNTKGYSIIKIQYYKYQTVLEMHGYNRINSTNYFQSR